MAWTLTDPDPPYPSPRKHTPSFCVFGPTGIYTPVSPLSLTSPHRVIPSEGKQQKYFFCFKIQLFGAQISNRTRPWALVQNQHTRELCLCYVFQALINFLCVDSLGHRYTGSLFTNTSIGRKKNTQVTYLLTPFKVKDGKGLHSPFWNISPCTDCSCTGCFCGCSAASAVLAVAAFSGPGNEPLETAHNWAGRSPQQALNRTTLNTLQLVTGLSPQQALNRTTLNTLQPWYWTFSAASTQQDNSQYITTLLLDFLRSKHSAGQLSTLACLAWLVLFNAELSPK